MQADPGAADADVERARLRHCVHATSAASAGRRRNNLAAMALRRIASARGVAGATNGGRRHAARLRRAVARRDADDVGGSDRLVVGRERVAAGHDHAVAVADHAVRDKAAVPVDQQYPVAGGSPGDGVRNKSRSPGAIAGNMLPPVARMRRAPEFWRISPASSTLGSAPA